MQIFVFLGTELGYMYRCKCVMCVHVHVVSPWPLGTLQRTTLSHRSAPGLAGTMTTTGLNSTLW